MSASCDNGTTDEFNKKLCIAIVGNFDIFVYVTFPLVAILLLLLLTLTISLICCCCKQRKRKKRMYVVDEDKNGTGNEISLNEMRTDDEDHPINRVTEVQYDVPTKADMTQADVDKMYDVVPDDSSHHGQHLPTFSSVSQSGNQSGNFLSLPVPNAQLADYANFSSVVGTQAELQQLQPAVPFESQGSIRKLPATQVYAVVDKSKKNRSKEGAEFPSNTPGNPLPPPPPPPPPPPLPVSYEQVSLRERDPPKQTTKSKSPIPGRQYHHLEHSNYPHPLPQSPEGLYDQIEDQKVPFHSSFSRSEELLATSSYSAKRYAQPTTNRTLTLSHTNPEGEGGTHGTFADPPPPPPLPSTDPEKFYPQQMNQWISAPKPQYTTDL